MRSRLVPALLSLVVLGSTARELGAQGRGQDARPGIAVLPFDNSGSYGQDKENFDALQKGIAGMLISELVDARIINVETSEIVKVESDRMQRDHLFDIIRTVAARLMKDANLPPLPRQASDQRMNRQVPTEALTFYAKALLYQDRGQKDKAVEMYQRALAVFPEYTEAQQGLQRVKSS